MSILVILAIVAASVVVVYGVFNYVIAMIDSKNGGTGNIRRKVYPISSAVAVFTVSAAGIAMDFLVLRAPQLVFSVVDWGWILLAGLGICGSFIFRGIARNKAWRRATFVGTAQMAMGVVILVLSIFGIMMAPKATYEISKPEDLALLSHLPEIETEVYQIKVMNDIDFEGFELDETYGNDNTYVIDGGGFVFRNMEYKVEIEEDEHYFLKPYTSKAYPDSIARDASVIKNLTIENSYFHVTPNYYVDGTRDGSACHFYLVPSDVKMEGVNIDITLNVHEAPEDPHYVTKSYLGGHYPQGVVTEGLNKIKVTVVKEGE